MRRNCGRQGGVHAPELSAGLPSPTSKPFNRGAGVPRRRPVPLTCGCATWGKDRLGCRSSGGCKMKQALPHAVPEALWGGPSGHMSVADTGRVTFARPCLTRGRFRIQIILLPKVVGDPTTIWPPRTDRSSRPRSLCGDEGSMRQVCWRGISIVGRHISRHSPSQGSRVGRSSLDRALSRGLDRLGRGRADRRALPVRGGWEGTGAPELARPQAGQTRPGGYGTTFEFTGTG